MLTTDWDLNCNEFSQIFSNFSPLWSIDQSIDLFGIIILNQVFYETGSVLPSFSIEASELQLSRAVSGMFL